MKGDTILALFKSRDKAVATKNRKLFLSTQTGWLSNSSFDVYAKIENMKTEIFSVVADESTPYQKVVFARETYFPKDKDSYSWFVIFYLIDTKAGWKIYQLTY